MEPRRSNCCWASWRTLIVWAVFAGSKTMSPAPKSARVADGRASSRASVASPAERRLWRMVMARARLGRGRVGADARPNRIPENIPAWVFQGAGRGLRRGVPPPPRACGRTNTPA